MVRLAPFILRLLAAVGILQLAYSAQAQIVRPSTSVYHLLRGESPHWLEGPYDSGPPSVLYGEDELILYNQYHLRYFPHLKRRTAQEHSDTISGIAQLRTGVDRALLFATNNYTDATLSDLINPIEDAESIGSELRERYGFEVEIVRNPREEDIYSTIDRYRRMTMSADDQIFIFFAGHGTYYGNRDVGQGYIIPSDGTSNRRSSWISHANLAQEVDALSAGRILLVLDVCYGGSFVERSRATLDPYGSASPVDIYRNYGRYRARLALTSGAMEYVSDGIPGRHSPFTHHILEALRSGGGEDGLLTFQDLVASAERTIDATPLYGGFGRNEPGSKFFLIRQSGR